MLYSLYYICLFSDFSVCYTIKAAVQKTVTSLLTPDVVGSIPTPFGDSSVGRTPLCLFWDFSACFLKIKRALQNTVTSIGLNFAARRGNAGSSPAELYSILSRFIFLMAAVQKTGSSCCRFESGFSF